MKGKMIRFLLVTLILVAFSVVAVCADGEGIDYIEDSIHVAKNTSGWDYPDAVQWASDHGCNDAWAKWDATNWNLPGGVWADNLLNQAHINAHNGLDGWFWCDSYGNCHTYLCSKHGGLYDAWTEKVTW